MSILSIQFVAFLVVSLAVYFLTPSKYQWIALLVISVGFYLFAGVLAFVFILFTTVTTFLSGVYIGKVNAEYDTAVANYKGPNPRITKEEKKALKKAEDKRKKRVLILALVLNFGILILLKYEKNLSSMFQGMCDLLGLRWDIQPLGIIVPLGISYYTFQSMGYLIDLYRRKIKAEQNLAHFMLFITFFPQLIQGPISRYEELADKLLTPHKFDYIRVKHGAELLIWGLFKKLVISDRIVIMTSIIFAAPEQYNGWYLLVGTIMATIQLYADFSGGIDMTRGVAEMFGIILPENFTRPFFATTLHDFWQRWHITLNNWWRDYIFYPFTLSKPIQRFTKRAKNLFGRTFGKKVPVLFAIIFIRILNSIWHGASGGSILCGAFYGISLALAFVLEPFFVRMAEKLKINTECFSWKCFQCVRTFLLFAIPRVVVNAKTLGEGINYIRCLFRLNNPWILFDQSLYQLGISQDAMNIVFIGLLIHLLVSSFQETGVSIRNWLDQQNRVFRWIIYLAFLCAIVLFGAYGAGYDASAFTYQLI